MCSASIETYLLEKSRIVYHQKGERTCAAPPQSRGRLWAGPGPLLFSPICLAAPSAYELVEYHIVYRGGDPPLAT